MDELNVFEALSNPTTTGEPVTTQAPTVQIDNTPGKLPDGYLANGYYAATATGATYLRPEFVSTDAKTIAFGLSAMKPSDFNGLLKEVKKSRKRSLPFEARQTALAEMLPKSLALLNRKKAPALLVSFVEASLAAVQTDSDFDAFVRHADCIAAYLTAQKGGDNIG